ncbi:MAG: IclR family transcriptional regulator [Beijerinckiaceae bacterium]|nr:IclR family transcriptional regulator [Beijerinckiaceae bacterium]
MTDLHPAESLGAQSPIRTLRLLRLLGDAGTAGLSLAGLVAQSGLSKPTCRRLLIALMEEGMAVQDPATRLYFLGREIYLLGMVAGDRYGIHRVALDSVTRLAQRTGDAAFLQVRHGDDVVCLVREDGTFPLRSHVLKAGDRHLLGAGAGPLAILGALPEAEAEAYLAGHARPLAERYPALGPLLPGLLRETRERGYSLNRGVLFPGSWGMAMAIRGPSGRIEACLSLAAVESRMQPDREPELAALLAGEVRLVEQRLAREPGPATPLPGSTRRKPSP